MPAVGVIWKAAGAGVRRRICTRLLPQFRCADRSGGAREATRSGAKQVVQPTPVAPAARIDTTPANTEVPQRETVVAAPVIPEPAPAADGKRNSAREKRAFYPRMPRREIRMTPETLTMSDELLEMIRNRSGQQDTKANELFHALVLLVHEVKDQIDLYSIPKRGKWGTPTARAYPIEIKNAFLRALLQRGPNQS